jgi:thiol-disulfide isomerase/thioredoxin
LRISHPAAATTRPPTALGLGAIADFAEQEKTESSSWTASRGGFLPNLPKSASKHKHAVVHTVSTLRDYKKVVADETDRIVAVRFYAPWCRACRATEPAFNKLARELSSDRVKFVQVPLNQDNGYLHDGLGVTSLPFGHVYHPSAGLVEERKLNKHVFGEFQYALQCYVNGECTLDYDNEGLMPTILLKQQSKGLTVDQAKS